MISRRIFKNTLYIGKRLLYKSRHFFGGLPRWLSGKESACQVGDRLDPSVRKIPWRRKLQPTPVVLPGKTPQTGAGQATVHGVAE